MADLNVDVPAVFGVPPVNFAAAAGSVISLLIADAIGLLGGLAGPQWGIFLGGAPVVATGFNADNVISLEYAQEWILADYPIEQGGFESYDKVQTPFRARIRFSAGGSLANRQALLDAVAAIAGDFNLYSVVTPEFTYLKANVHHYDYRRTAVNGVGLIVVDVWLMEVRVSTQLPPISNAQQPNGNDQVNDGAVQAEQVSPLPASPTTPVVGSSLPNLSPNVNPSAGLSSAPLM